MKRFRILAMLLISVMTVMCFTACGGSSDRKYGDNNISTEKSDKAYKSDKTDKYSDKDLMSGKHNVVIDVKDYGVIKVELDADVAPITVTNFIKLVKGGVYDGLTFHRIMSGFMIQGGDPNGDGTGGTPNTIKGEFESNGVSNSISHVRGTISMARLGNDPDSASSQFFIVHEDSTFLDGEYAAFGKVTEGMEVVDKICENVKPIDDNGTVVDSDKPIINSIKMEE